MLRPVRVIEGKHFAHDDGHSRGVFASLRFLPNSSRDLLLLRWEASALFEFHACRVPWLRGIGDRSQVTSARPSGARSRSLVRLRPRSSVNRRCALRGRGRGR